MGSLSDGAPPLFACVSLTIVQASYLAASAQLLHQAQEKWSTSSGLSAKPLQTKVGGLVIGHLCCYSGSVEEWAESLREGSCQESPRCCLVLS